MPALATIELVLIGVGGTLGVVAVPLARRAVARHLEHAGVLRVLCIVGLVALGISLVGLVFDLASTDTLRFYHGMLTGIGVGTLASVIILYVIDARANRPTSGHQ